MLDNFALVKSKIDIKQYIKDNHILSNFKMVNGEINGVCPFHTGAKGFNFKTKDEIAQCFSGCGKTWDVIDLNMGKKHLDKNESLKDLAKAYNIVLSIAPEKGLEASKGTNRAKPSPLNKRVLEAIRGTNATLSEKLLAEINLTDDMALYGFYEYSNGETVKLIKKEDGIIRERLYSGYFGLTGRIADLDEKNADYLTMISVYNKDMRAFNMPKSYLGLDSKLKMFLNSQNGVLVKKADTNNFIKYLEDQYDGLLDHGNLHQKYMTKRCGFQKVGSDKREVFIYPNSTFPINADYIYNPEGSFEGTFTHKGTVTAWMDQVYSKVKDNSNAFFYLLAAFASILIEPLGMVENFILDLSGTTSTGKTTLQKVVASVYGKPDEMISDWNITANAIISKAVELNNFPMLLDDTKKAADKSIVGETMYQLSGGKEKGRSNQDGSYKGSRGFKNITLTTGETFITDYLSDGDSNGRGAYARVLSLPNGFLSNSAENAQITKELLFNTANQYGAIGYKWAKHINNLLMDPNTKDYWRTIYSDNVDSLSTKLKTDISRRQGNHVSVMLLAYKLLCEMDDRFKTSEEQNHLNYMVEIINQHARETDNFDNAINHYFEVADMNRHKFYKSEREIDGDDKNHEMLGIAIDDDTYYIFSRQSIADTIKDFGDLNDILKAWRERGYLIPGAKASNQKTVWINGKAKKVYVLKRPQVEETE